MRQKNRGGGGSEIRQIIPPPLQIIHYPLRQGLGEPELIILRGKQVSLLKIGDKAALHQSRGHGVILKHNKFVAPLERPVLKQFTGFVQSCLQALGEDFIFFVTFAVPYLRSPHGAVLIGILMNTQKKAGA